MTIFQILQLLHAWIEVLSVSDENLKKSHFTVPSISALCRTFHSLG